MGGEGGGGTLKKIFSLEYHPFPRGQGEGNPPPPFLSLVLTSMDHRRCLEPFSLAAHRSYLESDFRSPLYNTNSKPLGLLREGEMICQDTKRNGSPTAKPQTIL